MKVSSKSWHFKLAQYGGMQMSYPTVCNYIAYIFSGAICGIFDKVIVSWVLPLILDFGLAYIFYSLYTTPIAQPPIIIFLFFVYLIYFSIILNMYLDIGVYYGPLWVLRRFKVVTNFISKFCGKVEIVYEKE